MEYPVQAFFTVHDTLRRIPDVFGGPDADSLRTRLVLKNFQDSPSHRMFGHIHGALNVDENKN
jgi:hypothetical protein